MSFQELVWGKILYYSRKQRSHQKRRCIRTAQVHAHLDSFGLMVKKHFLKQITHFTCQNNLIVKKYSLNALRQDGCWSVWWSNKHFFVNEQHRSQRNRSLQVQQDFSACKPRAQVYIQTHQLPADRDNQKHYMLISINKGMLNWCSLYVQRFEHIWSLVIAHTMLT